MLVDDDPVVLEVAEMILVEAGFSVFTARNAIEAMGLLDVYGDAIRVVVTDVNMPEMTGFELAERLATSHAAVRVIFMSGNSSIARDLCAKDSFIAKPFGSKALTEKVREAFEKMCAAR